MAAAQATTADLELEEAIEPAEPAGKPKSSRRKLLLVGGGALVLLLAAGAAAKFSGLADGLLGGGEATETAAPAQETVGVFYDLPEMLVNLSTNGKKLGFLKLRVALELEDAEASAKIETVLPRIVDSFQTYLRGLRMDDLNGSAGLYRLREELLLRVSAAVKPVKVKDVLFKEMLVQ
jgi:flagellar FliL protein